jgi:hypothetical protein
MRTSLLQTRCSLLLMKASLLQVRCSILLIKIFATSGEAIICFN